MSSDGGKRKRQDCDEEADTSDDDISQNKIFEIKKKWEAQNKIRCQRYRDKKKKEADKTVSSQICKKPTSIVDEAEVIKRRKEYDKQKSQRYRDKKRASNFIKSRTDQSSKTVCSPVEAKTGDRAVAPGVEQDDQGHMGLKALLTQDYVAVLEPKAEPASDDEERVDGTGSKMGSELHSARSMPMSDSNSIGPDYLSIVPKQEPNSDEVLQCSPMLLSLLLRDERLNPNDPASYQKWLKSTPGRSKGGKASSVAGQAPLIKRQRATAASVGSAERCAEETARAGAEKLKMEIEIGEEVLQSSNINIVMSEVKVEPSDVEIGRLSVGSAESCAEETARAGAEELKMEIEIGEEVLQSSNTNIVMSEVKVEPCDVDIGSGNPTEFECAVCKRKFPHRFAFDFHRSTHHTIKERPYECADCGRKYPKLINLEYHLRAHTGERPFECTKCGKKFYQQSHLNTHERVHSGWKPHKCNKCSECFTANSQLKTHQKRNCFKDLECSQCGKIFDTHVGLTNHLRSHRRKITLAELGIDVIPRVKRS